LCANLKFALEHKYIQVRIITPPIYFTIITSASNNISINIIMHKIETNNEYKDYTRDRNITTT
jgi:hypothetical protein